MAMLTPTSSFTLFTLFFLHVMVKSMVVMSSSSIANVITVAKDGTGDFNTIKDAVLAAPANRNSTYYIIIKPGLYEEYVTIPGEKPFLALIGSGADKTLITGNRSSRNGYGINASATLTVHGAHFLLQGITVQNTYGPGTQAVALFCNADYAVFYKCTIKGYQDTLFVDKTKQFYRECDIYGTTDFIFGNATAVFQNCNLFARDTGAVFTAHSRDQLNETSGYVIQNCSLKASPEIAANIGANALAMDAYLGRPWRDFSTVIVMESFLDAIFNPLGWELMGNSTGENVTYREYHNRGVGANVTGRVNWKGYKVIRHYYEALKYTASQFIDGDTWIPQTGVAYNGGLIET